MDHSRARSGRGRARIADRGSHPAGLSSGTTAAPYFPINRPRACRASVVLHPARASYLPARGPVGNSSRQATLTSTLAVLCNPMPTYRLTPSDVLRARKLWRRGWTGAELADEFGVARETVSAARTEVSRGR